MNNVKEWRKARFVIGATGGLLMVLGADHHNIWLLAVGVVLFGAFIILEV